ncbi:hypothetical protein FRB93_002968 [Tulasnella sp. JGI-2019a]|nr:hypothetical protein FRB93_002968 [Tulasnella sp. JGI-2019a]
MVPCDRSDKSGKNNILIDPPHFKSTSGQLQMKRSSQKNGGAQEMCDFCKEYPKNTGLDYCSRKCGVAAAKQGQGQGTSDDNMCETCHQRPKRQEKDQSGRTITHPFCGRTCASASRTSRCKLRDCTKQAPAGEIYCGDKHAKEAVRNREATACSSCKELPANPGLKLCSKCQASGAGGAANGPLRRLKQQDAGLSEAISRFQRSWNAPGNDGPTPPEVHAVYEIILRPKYNKRFTDALERGEHLGGFTTKTSYFGGLCLCDIGVDGAQYPSLCDWTGCSMCAVVGEGFDVLEFDAVTHDGIYGPGIYTNQYGAHANKFTAGKTTNPYRAIISCSVVSPTVGSRRDEKHPVIADETGRYFCSSKDTVIPRLLIIYRLL